MISKENDMAAVNRSDNIMSAFDRKRLLGNGSTIMLNVLGDGSEASELLLANTKKAARFIGGGVSVRYIDGLKIAKSLGIKNLPALFLYDEPVSEGRVLAVSQITDLF